MRRRSAAVAVAGGAALAATVLTAPLGAAVPPSRDIAFAIVRDSDPIGQHSVRFERNGEDLIVTIDIDIAVDFGPITLFRYEHENREVWRDGRLVALDTWTNDDGSEFSVTARATPDGLQVEGAEGSFLAPADIIPTSYWNPATVDQDRLLDTQYGRLVDVTIQPQGEEAIAAGSATVEARRYLVSGSLDMSLWYTERGEWARITFDARGAEVDYVPSKGWAQGLRGALQ